MNLCGPFIEMLINVGATLIFELSAKSKNYSFVHCQPLGTKSGTTLPIFQMFEFNTEIREGKVRAELTSAAKLFEAGNCELSFDSTHV